MGHGRSSTLAVALIVSVLGGAEVATAHEPAADRSSERELYAVEAAALGAEHAAEHARQRRVELRALKRWRMLSPVERRARRRHRRAAATAFAEASAAEAGPPNVVGRWTQGPFRLYGSDFAIHAALLPTGKVLFWGRPAVSTKFAPGHAAYDPAADPGESNVNAGQASQWDPTKGYGADAFTPVTPPEVDIDRDGDIDGPAPLFCSGQSLLPSGEVLVVGGNLVEPQLSPLYEGPAGTRLAFTFNPWTERWTAQPDMSVGRWYPTQLLLPTGNTLLVGGYRDSPPGAERTRRVELFVPGGRLGGVGRVKRMRGADRQTRLYPHLFTLPSGKVLLAGPGSTDSALLSPRRWRWSELPRPSGNRIAGTAVLMGGGRGKGSSEVMQIGGFRPLQPLPSSPAVPALNSTESIDLESKRGRWRRRSSLEVGRSDHNTVLLPDGSMVTIGGGNGFTPRNYRYTTDAGHARRQVELYDPATRTWRLGPAQQEDRTYHSVALLLPDGRVWSAGDDNFPIEAGGNPSQHDTGEIYSPPYLFDEAGNPASRPTIVTAPDSVEWGRAFTVHTEGTAKKVVLVAPSAVTHGNDMQQRLVRLQVRARKSGSLDVFAPASRAVAPPGYYMLFVISNRGTPSIASWVRLGDDLRSRRH
jgi:hypothetical protein